MSDATDLPEPDCVDGAPHPRTTRLLFGQDRAVADFLTAYTTGRLHHGWLLTGPKGVGKATLAWQIARFLLATPIDSDDGLFGPPPAPSNLDIDPEHPVARRLLALSDPGLFLLRRGPNEKGDKLATEIRVDMVRKLKSFFSMSAADGGRRVVIVDSADELNTNAANAILKLLEEPPARTVILLISHQPARLLPTIRSRCRELRLSALGTDALQSALEQAQIDAPPDSAQALNALANGSVGAAIRLLNLGGVEVYKALLGLMATLPALDRANLLAFSDKVGARGKEAQLDLALTLIDLLAARAARTGVTGTAPTPLAAPNEAEILMRLSPDAAAGRRWAQAVQEAGARARHAKAVNVDPPSLVTDLILNLSRAV